MYQDIPSVSDITKALIQRTKQIVPQAKSDIQLALVNDFKAAHREHFEYFMVELINQLGKVEDNLTTAPADLKERIAIFHFMLNEVLPAIPFSNHTLSLDGLVSNALRENLEQFLAQSNKDTPLYDLYQQLSHTLKSTRSYDLSDIVNIADLQTNQDDTEFNACTDLLQLGASTPPGNITPEASAFLRKYSDYLQNPERRHELLNQLFVQLSTLENIDSPPLIRLETHSLAINTLHFSLENLCQHESLREMRARVLLLLNHHADFAFGGALRILRDNKVAFGQHLGVITRIKSAYKLIQNLQEETNKLYLLLLNNKAHEIYSQGFISELKSRIIEHYRDNANHELMMAEYADQFESRAKARGYIQKALNEYNRMKEHEKLLRALRAKTKVEVDTIFKTLTWQSQQIYKVFQSNNNLGDLLSAFYGVIQSQEADNLQAMVQFFENLQITHSKGSDSKGLAYNTLKNEIIDLIKSSTQLAPPSSLTQINHWKNHFDKVFKLIQKLKLCTQHNEIIIIIPEILKLLEALVNKMNDDANYVIIKAAGEIIDKLRCHVSEMNTLLQRHSTVEEYTANTANETSKAVFVLNDKTLQDAIATIFSADFHPKAPNHSLNLLLSDQSMTQQIIEAIIKKINNEMPSDTSEAQIEADKINNLLNESNRNINLLIYFINQILPKYPNIFAPKNEAVGSLFRLAGLYFNIGRLKFSSNTDYTYDDDVLSKTHKELFQILEKLLPDYNDYIYYLKFSKQSNQIWKAHLRVVQYQIDYANICIAISDFNQANKIVKIAQQSIIEVNSAIEEIADVTGISRHSLGNELVSTYGSDLAKANQILKAANEQIKSNIVVYMNDGILHCDNPQERVKLLFATLKDIPAEIDNPKYTAVAESLQKFWKSYPLRLGTISCIHNHCNQLLENADNSYDKVPTEKLNALENLQIGINGLYFIIKELTPYHDERFPNDQVTLSLQKEILIFMVLEAQLCWQLLAENKLPFGNHALFYQRLLSHYELFHQSIAPDFKKTLLEKMPSEPKYVSLQYQTLFEHAIFFGSVAEQFADFEWTNETHQHAKTALALLETAPVSSVQLDKCKRSYAKANRPTVSSYSILKNQFIALSEKVEKVEVFLKDFCKSHTFSLQKRNDDSLSIAEHKNDPQALGNLVLEMNTHFALPQIISDLSTIKGHLEIYRPSLTDNLHGINNLFSETIDCFVKQIDDALLVLNKQLKRLELLEAKRQKEEMLRIQQEIQKEYKKSLTRTKIVDEQPSISTASRKPAKPVQRERQRKREALFTFESSELTYEMIAELESQPVKQSKKLIRQQKRALKNQTPFATETTTTNHEPPVVSTFIPQPVEQTMVQQNPKQLKKIRRKQREQVAEEQSDALLLSLIEEVAALTLNQEKLTATDELYRVPDVAIERVPHLQKLLDFFVERSIKAYGYGGYPRDTLLNRQHKDLDLVVFCSAETLMNIFGTTIRAHESLSNQFSFQGDIDIRCAEGSLLEFANGLDTTANALFVDANGHLYDPKGGYSHLFVSDQLETIGNTERTFAEDPIRMYRLLRQSLDLQKSIQEKDLLALKQHAKSLCLVNFRDYRKHFSRLFLNGKAELQLDFLFRHKLLAFLLPQLQKANYSYLFVHYWLKMQCKRVDENLNRKNDYPFYKLIAIMLAPHCYSKSLVSALSPEEVIHNVVVDFFASFTNYKPKKEFNFLKEQLSLFCGVYQHDATVHLQRMREKQLNKVPAPIVHQFQASKKAITITIDGVENGLPNTMHIRIMRRTNGIT